MSAFTSDGRAALSSPPGFIFPAVLAPPQCARCQEPLADTDVLFADGRHCMHCWNVIRPVTMDPIDEECIRG